MENQFSRTQLLYGEAAIQKLAASKIAIFGAGGVGCYAVEALARSGIGALDIIDGDVFCESNLNRQLYALHSTLGQSKAEVAKARVLDINPHAVTRAFNMFYSAETAARFNLSEYDYIVDAIDSVKDKIELIANAKRAGVKIISCMGAGNKLNPAAFEVADIYQTSVCPLAKIMRRELKKRGIESLKVVYSKEPPADLIMPPERAEGKIVGSTAFSPSVAGLIMAGEIVNELAR